MRIHTLSLGLAAGLALAACSDIRTQSGPPVAGTSAGPGAPPLVQDSRNIGGGSANASAGTPSITGTRSGGSDRGGAPTIDYSGPGSAGAGSTSPVDLPTTPRSRSNKGG
jgi:hypothetical protein